MGVARALLGLGLIAALAGCEMDANGQARGFLSGFESPGTSGGRDALSKPGDGPPPVPRAVIRKTVTEPPMSVLPAPVITSDPLPPPPTSVILLIM